MQRVNLNLKIVTFILFLAAVPLFGQSPLFPQIQGWSASVDKEVYDANNLWDIIDGAADLYLEYGFVDLHTARYVNADSAEVKVEVYTHNSPLNAFGMYSQERDPGYNFINIGTQGYLQQGVLNFLDGVYYIKLSTYQKGSKGQESLLLIAKKLNENLKQENSFPKILSRFPQKGKLKNKEQFVSRNFLGYSFFNSTFTAVYDSISLVKGFICEAKSNEQANELLANYIKAASVKKTPKENNGRYLVNDINNGLIEIAVVKHFVVGLIKSSSKKFSNDYFKELNENLLK